MNAKLTTIEISYQEQIHAQWPILEKPEKRAYPFLQKIMGDKSFLKTLK